MAVQTEPRVGLFYDRRTYERNELPDLPKALQEGQRRAGEPFTVQAADHKRHWRLLVTELQGGGVLAVGEDLSDVDSAVDRLLLINVLVGFSVLVALALVGVWVVRASLRPLVDIERTAAAIAGGDLTQRVPELDPRTELGRLSRALNTMLAQIESAFLARAASEQRRGRPRARPATPPTRQGVRGASRELRGAHAPVRRRRLA